MDEYKIPYHRHYLIVASKHNINPVIINCLFLYLTVIILSLLQSRFRIYKDNPVSFVIMLLVVPLMVFGKSKGIKTWTGLTGMQIFGYTLVLSLMSARRILPKLNEGYIYAYTLLHWYLLIELFKIKGIGFWDCFVSLVSIYPTYLIIKAVFEYKLLSRRHKMILYYWFLFTVAFTFIDQFALEILTPILTLREVSFENYIIIFFSAIQLYFISTIFGLIFTAIPLFHLDRNSEKFKVRWRKAMREWRKLLNSQLDDFIEYQINYVQLFYITILTSILFYLDNVSNFRQGLIFTYTVVLPIVFFYLKWTPIKNIEENEI